MVSYAIVWCQSAFKLVVLKTMVWVRGGGSIRCGVYACIVMKTTTTTLQQTKTELLYFRYLI